MKPNRIKSMMCATAVAGFATAAAWSAEPATTVRAEVELTDGSRLIGTPMCDKLSINMEYAKAEIPLAKIAKCELRPKDERIVLTMVNGDKITGLLEVEAFPLDTILGTLSPKFAQIERLSFTTTKLAGTFNAAKDFSKDQNPVGPWSYGWVRRPGEEFNLCPRTWPSNDACVVSWVTANGGTTPGVAANLGNETIHPCDTMTIEPHQLWLHPGAGNEYGVVRWTAPKNGTIHVKGRFFGLSGYNGAPKTTTDVMIWVAGKEMFSCGINVNGKGNEAVFDQRATVRQGETVDFLVGTGGNGYGYDSTALDAMIEVE